MRAVLVLFVCNAVQDFLFGQKMNIISKQNYLDFKITADFFGPRSVSWRLGGARSTESLVDWAQLSKKLIIYRTLRRRILDKELQQNPSFLASKGSGDSGIRGGVCVYIMVFQQEATGSRCHWAVRRRSADSQHYATQIPPTPQTSHWFTPNSFSNIISL